MRNVTEIQQRLIALQYLPPTYIDNGIEKKSDDGKFGQRSLDAYNRWRASKGAGPVKGASMEQLNIDLFPEEQPAAKPQLTPNPVVQAIGALALKYALNQLKGYFPMSNILAGQKTIILGVVTIVVGVLALLGWDIPGFNHVPGGIVIDSGLAMIFLRLGIKNAVTDMIEKVVSGLGK